MTEEQENIPGYKIYKDKFMFGISYLGGPLAAGYIIAENFKAFGDRENYKKTWQITIITTIIIFAGVLLIPESINIPNFIIPFTYSFAAAWLIRQHQGKLIDEHIKVGGPLYSGWRAFLVALICIIITLAIVLPIAIFMIPDEKSEVYIQPFRSMNHEITYNPDHIDKAEVKFLGEQLAQINYLDSTYTMYLYVDKEDRSIKISIPFENEWWNEPNTIAYYKEVHDILKMSYQKKYFIEILMCDTQLDVKRTFK